MTTQLFSLCMEGLVVGATATASIKMGAGAVQSFTRSDVHELGSDHKVVVLTTGDSEINNLPVGLVISQWKQTLSEPLSKVEDYAASFITFLEDADLRMFPDFGGYANWQRYATGWLLESKSYSLINKFFEESEELQKANSPSGPENSEEVLQARHDLLLKLINDEISRLYRTNENYASLPISVVVDSLSEQIALHGFQNSWGAHLASAFEGQLESTNSAEFDNNKVSTTFQFPLSPDFENSVTLLTALVLATRNPDAPQGAIFSFAGYGSAQNTPRLASIVVDGVFIQAKYYPVKLHENAHWMGLNSDALEDEPQIEVDGETYPLWVSSPSSNEPIVFGTAGERNVLEGYLDGIQSSESNRIQKGFTELIVQFSEQRDEAHSDETSIDTEISAEFMAENLLSTGKYDSRASNFQSIASSLTVDHITRIVDAVMTLQTFEGAFNDQSDATGFIGGPVDVLNVTLDGITWKRRAS